MKRLSNALFKVGLGAIALVAGCGSPPPHSGWYEAKFAEVSAICSGQSTNSGKPSGGSVVQKMLDEMQEKVLQCESDLASCQAVPPPPKCDASQVDSKLVYTCSYKELTGTTVSFSDGEFRSDPADPCVMQYFSRPKNDPTVSRAFIFGKCPILPLKRIKSFTCPGPDPQYYTDWTCSIVP